jgi:hypothetical protein
MFRDTSKWFGLMNIGRELYGILLQELIKGSVTVSNEKKKR